MAYKYWGHVEIHKEGACAIWIKGRRYILAVNQLPKWVRNKIVLLDFMEDNIRLQCQSHKTTFTNAVCYYLYKSEDERKRP